MRLKDYGNKSIYVFEAPIWDSDHSTLKGRDHLLMGIMPRTQSTRAEMGLSAYIGQLYGIVDPGLIHAKHVFQGLKRAMMVGDDVNADGKKLAVTWAHNRDARLIGSEQNCAIEFSDAPPAKVFVVYISVNQMLEEFSDIYGWIEHWTWLAADKNLAGAPVDWETRYDKRLWQGP